MTGATKMSEDTKQTAKTVQRRGFFATFGVGGVAVVATALVAAPETAEAMTPTGGKAGSHYKESEHIKKFYRVNSY
jgi:hypothetical protein